MSSPSHAAGQTGMQEPAKAPPVPITAALFRALVAERQPFYEAALDVLATYLPVSDAELHEWLEAAIEANDKLMFVYAISAAAISGRRLKASLLPGGACLMRTNHQFVWIAWHAEGDVTEALLKAVRDGGLSTSRQALALFYAAAWWEKYKEGPMPAEIVATAREIARRQMDNETHLTLAALYQLTGSKELQSLVPLGRDDFVVRTAGKAKKSMLEMVEDPFAYFLPEKSESGYSLGRPMRRSLQHIGRNELCPCGSGKKYKHCCIKEGEERLRRSTDVSGLTNVELDRQLDAYVTKARLVNMPVHELARLDPSKLSSELMTDYLARLACFKRWNDLINAFKKVGVAGEREDDWRESFSLVVKDWQRDIAVRLLKVHPRGKEMLSKLEPGVRILLASRDERKFWKAVEAEAMSVLESGDRVVLRRFAIAMLASPYSALGIFVARSVLPLIEDAPSVFDEILHARDKLNLSPDDEFSDFMEERAARRRSGGETTALREAREKLEAKAAEVRQAREKLATLQREITLGEKRERRNAAVSAAESPPSEIGELRDLRDKVKALKSLITEHAEERLALRRELENLHGDLELLKSASAANADHESDADEEEAGEAIEVSGNQPVRLIEFPKKFAETLAGFPQHVARAAMRRLGRMGAAEPDAFDFIKKIKAFEDVLVLEARVSERYRLLFCLLPKYIRVVGLVYRPELDKFVDHCKIAGLPPVAEFE